MQCKISLSMCQSFRYLFFSFPNLENLYSQVVVTLSLLELQSIPVLMFPWEKGFLEDKSEKCKTILKSWSTDKAFPNFLWDIQIDVKYIMYIGLGMVMQVQTENLVARGWKESSRLMHHFFKYLVRKFSI